MTELSRRQALALTAALAALPGAAAAQDPTTVAAWDLSDLYADDAAWEAERAAVAQALPKIAAYRGHLGQGGAGFKAALAAISDINRRVQRLGVYASSKADEDLGVAANQERRQLAIALSARFGEAISWANPEILALGPARIEALLAADPGLARFAFGLRDVLRLAPHTLDSQGEALLASTAEVLAGPQQIRNQLVASDIPWPEIQLAQGKVRLDSQGYTAARTSPDRAERQRVFDTFFGTLATYRSTLGTGLATQVQSDVFQARARHYDSALAAALAPNNLPSEVYRTLVAEAGATLPVLHRYFEVRRRMLGLPDMRYIDLYPPATRLARRFDLAETRRLTLDAMKPLGADYVAILARATAARWMDAYPRKGKASGAYMNGSAYDVHPYLLLNHTDDYESVSTFAHEWGHAMHTVLTTRAQPFELSNYPTFLAEVASTVNEQLLAERMLQTAKSREEKLFYLDRICELLRGTFYRQTMFAEFELAIHEAVEKGGALSGEKLDAIYLALLRRYHGPKVIIDPAYAVEWAYIPHFYFNFYVFQYATSIAAAVAFADRLLAGKAADREAYLGVLKAGGSDYPVPVLQRAGVDMTSPAPYRALAAKLGRTLDRMEALLA